MKYLYLLVFFVNWSGISKAQKMRPVVSLEEGKQVSMTKNVYNLVWADEFDVLDTLIWNRSYPGNDSWEITEPDFCKKNGYCVPSRNNVEHLADKGMVRCWFTAAGAGEYCKYNYGEIKTFSSNDAEQFSNWRIMPNSYTEVRLRLPACEGVGAAFWLYGLAGNGKDAKIYEIDIFELYGINGKYRFQSDLHFGNCYGCKNRKKWHNGVEISPLNEKGEPVVIGEQFLTFGVEYTRESIDYYLNGNMYYRNVLPKRGKKAKYLEPLPCFIRLGTGLALGGDPSTCTSLPQAMDIDYVRVYRKNTEKAIHYRPGNSTLELCNVHDWNDGDEVRVTFLPGVKYTWSADSGIDFKPYERLQNELKSWWVSADKKLPTGNYAAILRAEFPSGRIETLPLQIKIVNEPRLAAPEGMGSNRENFSSRTRVSIAPYTYGYEWSYDSGVTWQRVPNTLGESYNQSPKRINGKRYKAGTARVRAYNTCYTSAEVGL